MNNLNVCSAHSYAYPLSRFNSLINDLINMNIDTNIETLLVGNDTYTDQTNSKMFEKVRFFIKQITRYCTPSQQL